MRRSLAVSWALLVLGCSDERYVIGRYDADASSDAALAPGASTCAVRHRSALFCSGFEADLDAAVDRFAVAPTGELERTEQRAFRGASSLRATTLGPMSYANVVAALPAVQEGTLHFRAYAYVASGLATEIMNLFFLGAEPGPDPFQGIDFNVENGEVQIFSPQFPGSRRNGTALIPRDRWFCYRAVVQLAEDSGSVQIYLDDELALDARGLDTVPADGVREFRAGIDWSSQQTSSFDIFLDELVVDRAPVECDPEP